MTQEGPENANLERSHEEEFEDCEFQFLFFHFYFLNEFLLGTKVEERLTPENEHIRRFGLCYNFIQTTFDTHGGRMVLRFLGKFIYAH